MVNEPLVSVIMITYNHENYIEEAINGVLMQECDFDFELIVANDCSPDNTDEVIRRILHEHSKLTFIKYINRGANVGMIENFMDSLKRSNGKYIALCEGDDYWTDPLKLQKQVNFLEKNGEYAMACHNALVMDEINSSSRLFFDSDHQKQICTTKDTLNIHFCPTASILFRKQAISTLDEVGINSLAPMSSDHLLVQLISLNGLIFRTQEVMSVYRQHLDGMSTIASSYLKAALLNRISALLFLNKTSEYKFQKNIRIEVLLIKNRIALLECKTKYKIKLLKLYRLFLSKGRNYLIQKK